MRDEPMQLAVLQQQIFEAVADPGRGSRPGHLLDVPAVGRTADLSRGVVQPEGTAANADIAPAAGLHDPYDLAPAPTLRTPAPVLVGLHRDHDGRFLPASFEPHVDSAKSLELEQLGEELHSGHRSPSLSWGVLDGDTPSTGNDLWPCHVLRWTARAQVLSVLTFRR